MLHAYYKRKTVKSKHIFINIKPNLNGKPIDKREKQVYY
nr:MAG TPA: hypothetical protein [Caudoviricetes sp.]